ncbi:stage II sporulation protein M [bacterium]|nr:stage II sporulation protein M [bacterium]
MDVKKNISKIKSDKIAMKEKRWFELNGILTKLEKGSSAEATHYVLTRLGTLYFQTLSDLSEVQASSDYDPQIKLFLNNLIGRAYAQIYRKKSLSFKNFINFFLSDFPKLFRKRIHPIIFSLLIFAFSALVGYLCLDFDSKLLKLVIPDHMLKVVKARLAQGDVGNHDLSNQFAISSKIMFNNIRVSFIAFAAGILFGIGTIYLLIVNGMMLGGLASLYHSADYAMEFWSLILPHGVIELPCIFICAGAGFIIGYALINPGCYKRSEWFYHEGLEAVKLLVGSIPLFIIAGLVESYITPANLSIHMKYIISGGILFILGGYLFYGIDVYKWDLDF